jgi:hypothetical protein
MVNEYILTNLSADVNSFLMDSILSFFSELLRVSFIFLIIYFGIAPFSGLEIVWTSYSI